MPNATETIGTGETYTTIQGWEDALAADHQHRGECKAEVFSNMNFNGVAYTATNYPHLTSQDGAEHDGRAHEVSGAGNARIEFDGADNVIRIEDEFVRVSWMEIKGPGNNAYEIFGISPTVDDLTIVHHCILHNNGASTDTGNYGLEVTATSTGENRLYRNIIYGIGSAGLRTRDGTGACLLNTLYKNNYAEHASLGGIYNTDEDYAITANASFDNFTKDIVSTVGTLDYNATSDTTGDDEGANGIANLTTANQFVAPTDTWANTDLLLRAGADLIDEGPAPYSTATYPEIDESIDNRGVSITGTWDIGASQFVGGAPPEGNFLPGSFNRGMNLGMNRGMN